MNLNKPLNALLASVLGAGVLLSGAVNAQNYPDKPVTLVVPFAAGGPTDSIARLIAVPMGKSLGQTVVVENAPGAGGTVASNKVAIPM